MKKALIDPTSVQQHIIAWVLNPSPTLDKPQKYIPVYEIYKNSARVCEVEESDFPVAPPLFWTDCADDVVADKFYYDTITNQINPIVNAIYPSTQGLQSV